MIAFNGLYEDLDGDHRYDHPGLTIWRLWLTVAPDTVFGDDIGDWWHRVDQGRYLRYQTSLLLRAFQGDRAGAPLGFDYFNGRDRNVVLVESIKAVIGQLKARYPGKDMADWKLPIFWKYYDPARQAAGRPALPGAEEGSARLSAVLGLGPAMAPHNGGEGWVGLMEIDARHRALYSVVDAGGQNQFISPTGRGNPNLFDQAIMHESNELKKIVMDSAAVRAGAVSKTVVAYPAPSFVRSSIRTGE